MENKNVGLKVGGHKHTIAPPVKKVGGHMPPLPPPPPASYASDIYIYIYTNKNKQTNGTYFPICPGPINSFTRAWRRAIFHVCCDTLSGAKNTTLRLPGSAPRGTLLSRGTAIADVH